MKCSKVYARKVNVFHRVPKPSPHAPPPPLVPLPRPLPLAIPLPPALPLAPLLAPPLVGIPPPLPPARGIPPLPLVAAAAFFSPGPGVTGFWNLFATLLLGGLSTKEVSVVRNVASTSGMGFSPPGPWEERNWSVERGRVKDSGMGAWALVVSTHG